jgi:hypothetical protein
MDFIGPDHEKKMGSIFIIILKTIEVLLKSHKKGNQFKIGFRISSEWDYRWFHLPTFGGELRLEKWERTSGSSFRRKVGFFQIKKVKRILPSGPSFFLLPYRVPMNL